MQRIFYYSDKPITNDVNPIKITQGELERKTNFIYCDKVLSDNFSQSQQEYDENIMDLPSRKTEEKKYKQLERIEQHLAICFMGSNVGHGVFAVSDIPENTCLGIYAGKLHNNTTQKINDDYVITTRAPKKFPDLNRFLEKSTDPFEQMEKATRSFMEHQTSINKSLVGLSAKEQGNLSRFFQHLPTSNAGLREIIATENLKRSVCFDTDSNETVVIFITDRNIKKGEQLGFDYGDAYWDIERGKPKYFTLSGQVISEKSFEILKKEEALLKKIKIDKNFFQQLNMLFPKNQMPQKIKGWSEADKNKISEIAQCCRFFNYPALCNLAVVEKEKNAELSPLLEFIRTIKV